MSFRQRFLIIEFLLFGFFVVWGAGDLFAAEEKFPTKPINLLVGFAAGGSADLTSRAIAESASKTLGQPVVVLNKGGSGGAVALGELKNAKPDGYTIAFSSTGAIMNPHLYKATYHPINDFDAILRFSVFPFGLAARADAPYKSFKEFIAYAQANPNKIKYSTAGAGTPGHLVMLQLGDLFNVKWTNVPFGGAVEATSAVLGGHVDCISQSAEWKPYVLSGRLRLLVMYGEKRMESFPDVPTLLELGYNIKALSIACFIAPKGVPQDRLKIIHDAFYKGLDTPGLKKALDTFDWTLAYQNSQDTEISIREIYEISGKIIEKHREAMKKN